MLNIVFFTKFDLLVLWQSRKVTNESKSSWYFKMSTNLVYQLHLMVKASACCEVGSKFKPCHASKLFSYKIIAFDFCRYVRRDHVDDWQGRKPVRIDARGTGIGGS